MQESLLVKFSGSGKCKTGGSHLNYFFLLKFNIFMIIIVSCEQSNEDEGDDDDDDDDDDDVQVTIGEISATPAYG